MGDDMGYREDLSGKRFNMLVVIKFDHYSKKGTHTRAHWLCQCDCGNTNVVASDNLKSGGVKSCGCARHKQPKSFIDLSGLKFNRLLVINEAFVRNQAHYWNCKCDCGTEKIINGSKLKNGRTKSCGCLQFENRHRGYSEATFNAIYSQYKSNARKRNLDFELDKNYFKKITQQNCFYCGAEPNCIRKSTSGNGDYIYNGIDRLDSLRGYVIDNVVPCCPRCNEGKMDIPLNEFLDWIKRIYEYKFINNN
jgi:hypothetical protein